MLIVMLAKRRAFSKDVCGGCPPLPEFLPMTVCEAIDAGLRPRLWRVAKLLLFCLTEGAAVLLIGFAALFVNFHPAWSAGVPPAGWVRAGAGLRGSAATAGSPPMAPPP